jgi:hypothetical protein
MTDTEREKVAEEDVKRLITRMGGWWVKTHGDQFSRPGIPDLLVCYKGFFAGIEMKSATGTPSDDQERELARIKDAGGLSIVARSAEQVVRDVLMPINVQATILSQYLLTNH